MSAPAKEVGAVSPVPAVARPAATRAPGPPAWALKFALAITGTILVGFVVIHMLGNLKVFLGKEAINTYAFWLKEDMLAPLIPHGWFIWIFRGVMTLSLLIHMYAAVVVRRRARKARGAFRRTGLKGLRNFQARSMLVTGAVLLLFLIFHLLDQTIGAPGVAPEGFEHGDAYANLVASFERPAVAVFYILAMGILFLHLAHGLWSVVNDLGATGRRVRAVSAALAGVIGLVVMLGNITIPFAVLVGAVS